VRRKIRCGYDTSAPSAPFRPHHAYLVDKGRRRGPRSRRDRAGNHFPIWNADGGLPIIMTFPVARICGMIPARAKIVQTLPATVMSRPPGARNETRDRPVLAPRLAEDERRRRNEPGSPGTAVITKTKTQTKRPNLYRVLLLNDDYTPMEFVVHVLERFFNKDRETATRIMLHVHHHGIGECGVFTYEVAETKVTQVMDFSRKHQHPLQCVMEKK
jgi:ATP-dependent Clp protease adaptor protein ClpS